MRCISQGKICGLQHWSLWSPHWLEPYQPWQTRFGLWTYLHLSLHQQNAPLCLPANARALHWWIEKQCLECNFCTAMGRESSQNASHFHLGLDVTVCSVTVQLWEATVMAQTRSFQTVQFCSGLKAKTTRHQEEMGQHSTMGQSSSQMNIGTCSYLFMQQRIQQSF